MPESPWPAEVDLAAYVADIEAVQQKFRLPPPVIVLAADLLQRVPRRAAVRNASELVAALLVRAAHQGSVELAESIGDYRETRVYSILAPDAEAGMYQLPPRAEIDLG
jgi:hypothetical protein